MRHAQRGLTACRLMAAMAAAWYASGVASASTSVRVLPLAVSTRAQLLQLKQQLMMCPNDSAAAAFNAEGGVPAAGQQLLDIAAGALVRLRRRCVRARRWGGGVG